jgi:hypothetical protein
MSLFNCLGGFSFRTFAIATIVAGLFSWFVLHNTDATVFFGIAALISLVVHTQSKSIEDRFDGVYRQMDDNHTAHERTHEALYRYVDDRIDEECHKGKR